MRCQRVVDIEQQYGQPMPGKPFGRDLPGALEPVFRPKQAHSFPRFRPRRGQPAMNKTDGDAPHPFLSLDYLNLRLRAASDFFLRFTEGFS